MWCLDCVPLIDSHARLSSNSSRIYPSVSQRELIESAVDRFKSSLFKQNFVPEMLHARGASFEPDTNAPRIYVHQISIEICQTLEDESVNASTPDEAYYLQVSKQGAIHIKATSFRGTLYALNSLSQLFYAHSESDDVYCPNAPVTMRDYPSFEHRAVHVDIARNRIFPADVKRTIEAMSFNKLNKLHLHATDSQSWPIDIPSLPELASKGAYHKSQVWSPTDLQEVQDYGLERGIEVYLEIDMPGHTASIHHAYPDLVTAYDAQPWEDYSAEPPAGQLKLNSTAVSAFLQTLLDDLLPRIAPYSTHFHLGGDELNAKAHELDETVRSSSKDILRPLVQAFYDAALARASAHGLTTPILWEEALLDWDLALPPAALVQIWRSPASLAAVTERGHRALFSAASHWYLDCGFGGFADPRGPDGAVRPPFADWCAPYHGFRQVLAYDPLAGVPAERRGLVVGGVVCLWTELTDAATLDGKLWPRAAAAAEVLWRGKGEVGEDATRRLAEMRERLVARGIGAMVVQMEWCLRNRGSCLQ